MRSKHLSLILLIWSLQISAQQIPMHPTLNATSESMSLEQWEEGREQLLELFKTEMYGCSPAKTSSIKYYIFDESSDAFGGKAVRKQVRILWEGKEDGQYTDMLIYLPINQNGKVPVLVGLNFQGNQTITTDPAVRISEAFSEDPNYFFKCTGVVEHKATEQSRGSNADDWPVEAILEHGYGIATAYREEIASDRVPYFSTGIHLLFPDLQERDDNFSTISAWAWALSRMVDYLETDPMVDTDKIGVFGFSRLGKAALWAGAQDERFSAVISQMSGAGGAKLFRRHIGEDIHRLCTVFPHWYCHNFSKYDGKDETLPFDQDKMMSLIAPRALYVSSALDDAMSDPAGEYEGLMATLPIYQLYSHHPKLGYHIRPGGHDVLTSDWNYYLQFLDNLWEL